MCPLVQFNPFKLTRSDDSTTKSFHEDICRDKPTTATVAGSGVVATMATSRLRAAAAEREMVLAFDGGVAATAAGNSCRRAPSAERVVGVPRTPNRDATRTTLH